MTDVIRADHGRLSVRWRSLRAQRATGTRRLLPLHPLSATHRDGLIGAGANRRTHVRLVKGAHLVKCWRHSDGGFEKCFCRDCGSHLFSRDPEDARQMSVRLSAFDRDPGVRPSFRAFVAYAAPWEQIPDDGLERFPEARPRPAFD